MPGTSVASLPGVSAAAEAGGQKVQSHYRIVIMGAAKVGKTAIVHQFLYDSFPVDHKATVEELHRGEYELGCCDLILEILDTSGSYQFPAMRRLAINTSDAFILVYAIDDSESFDEVRRLRESILEIRPSGVPIVVVGNKSDLDENRVVRKELAETVVSIDWENGFIECSAKENTNILDIFKVLLVQARLPYDISPAVQRRRKSLPAYPTSPSIKDSVLLKRNSCAVS